jgi:hypothetical protein
MKSFDDYYDYLEDSKESSYLNKTLPKRIRVSLHKINFWVQLKFYCKVHIIFSNWVIGVDNRM